MNWVLLCLLPLGFSTPKETAEPDVFLLIPEGDKQLVFGFRIETSKGPLSLRQTELLKGIKVDPDQPGSWGGLLPNGGLIRAQVAPSSPHVEPLTHELFQALDKNHDGQISLTELKGVSDTWISRFDLDDDEAITPLEIVPDLLTLRPENGGKMGQARFLFPGEGQSRPKPDQMITLNVDTPFHQVQSLQGYKLDINVAFANPLVIPAVPKSLLRPDRVTERERFSSISREIISITIRPQPRGWFELLDINGDGQLSIRELKAAEKILEAQFTDSKTIPFPDFASRKIYSVSLSRGAVTRPPLRFSKAPASEVGPTWFHAMDKNGDGDLSRREFLGTFSQFQIFDLDHDGLISPQEAEKADQKFKK